MAEDEERNWLRIILPRVVEAAFWSFIMGAAFFVPLMLMQQLGIDESIQYGQIGFSSMVVIFIAFEFAIHLLSGTIIRYALSTARTIISMALLIVVTNGGIITSTIPSGTLPYELKGVQITVDFSWILAALLVLSLLSIAKNILQALDFLSEKAEEPMTLPEPP